MFTYAYVTLQLLLLNTMSLWDDRVRGFTADYLKAKLEYEQMELAIAGAPRGQPDTQATKALKQKLEQIKWIEEYIPRGLWLGKKCRQVMRVLGSPSFAWACQSCN